MNREAELDSVAVAIAHLQHAIDHGPRYAADDPRRASDRDIEGRLGRLAERMSAKDPRKVVLP